MRLAIISLALVVFGGCSSGIGSHERLGWYVPFVPDDLVVERFYETPSPSMDHEYMWKIKLSANEAFAKFEQQFINAPPNVAGINDYGGPCVFDEHPTWWKSIDFTNGVLHQHRVTVVGSGGGEWASIFALFDKEDGYLYLQAF